MSQGSQMTPDAIAKGIITPNHSALGFEYQMLDDDRHVDGKIPSHRAGALYELVAPNAGKRLRPVGQWNESKTVFRGNHGEHWLNGAKLLELDRKSTRLNSSHSQISYAVFCLKKKKQMS